MKTKSTAKGNAATYFRRKTAILLMVLAVGLSFTLVETAPAWVFVNSGNCTATIVYRIHYTYYTFCEQYIIDYWRDPSGITLSPGQTGVVNPILCPPCIDAYARDCDDAIEILYVILPSDYSKHYAGLPLLLPIKTYGPTARVFYNCAGLAPDPDDEDGSPENPCQQPGMPTWQVSEPHIGLWILDQPLSYQPAVGPRIALDLAYKQRGNAEGGNSNIFSFGKRWTCSWLSYLVNQTNATATTNLTLRTAGGFHSSGTGSSGGGTSASGGGGGTGRRVAMRVGLPWAGFLQAPPQDVNYQSNTRMVGDKTNGFTLIYSDGSRDFYGLIVTNGTGTFRNAFMTERWNAIGQKTRLDYAAYTPGDDPVIRLKYVVDGDNKTNSLYYVATNAYSTNLVSQVVDAFGRTNYLAYDNEGRLTNIIDVVGLPSSFGYSTNCWVTNLTTPYGPTSFQFTEPASTNTHSDTVGRAILVTEPDGGKQLFLYTNNAPGIVSSYPTNEMPSVTAFAPRFDTNNLNLRTSFHWDRRQYAALSTTNITVLTSNDYRLARMRHWLKATATTFSPSVSLERSPSPDSNGTTEGQKTWFDYAGKTANDYQGTQLLSLLSAQVLPDGTTRFMRTDRNSIGWATNVVDTYSIGANVYLRTNIFAYDSNATDLLTITNALGVQIASKTYNTNHQVLTHYNALHELTAFAYDGNQRLASVNWPSGLVTTNTYASDGYLAQQIHQGIATNSYTWSNGLVFTHTDPRGLTLTYTWDALERLRRADFPDGTFITNCYDKLDLARVIDRMGYTNVFGYNSVRQMTAATNTLGNYTLFDYCSCGSLNWVRDAANNYTYFFYDNAGRRTNTVYPDGYAITNRYNLGGQLTNVLDSGGASVTNWFNNQGLLLTSSNALGRIFLTTYDLLDRATNTIDANGVIFTNAFDNLNRLITRSYPDGGLEKFGYSAFGLIAYTNQLEQVTRYRYDTVGRKTAETNANNEVVQFTYNGAGDLRTLTDGKNQTTSWGYDNFGRLTSKTNATGTEVFRFGYNPNGQLTNRWTAAKGTTVYRHDFIGNLTNVDYAASPDISLQYDSLNRLTNMVDAVGTNYFTYNTVSQLLAEDGPWSSDTVSYTYTNRLRRSLSLVQPSAADWTNGYAYDVARRLTNLTSQAGSFGYAYDSTRKFQIASLTLPNSAYVTNTYDAVARLLSTQLKTSGGTVLDSHGYGYNLAHQRTALTNTAGNYLTYGYDGIGQLKTALGFEANAALRFNEQLGYAYDAAGNLNRRTNNAFTQTFTVNSLNELTAATRNGTFTVAGNTTTTATNVTVNTSNAVLYADRTFASTNHTLANGNNTFTAVAQNAAGLSDTNTLTVNLPGTNNFSYDLNGNLRTNGPQILEYDDENQLVTNWVAAAWKSEFVYDGANRKRIQRDYGWSGGAWVKTNEARFVYDGNLPIQHRSSANTPTLTLTRGLDLSLSLHRAGGIGGLLAMTESSGAHTYYHADGNGNVTTLLNANQLIVARYLYDPFGSTLSISGPKSSINPYRFSSKPQHDLSGKYDFLRRWYDPSLQRWLNQDPIAEGGGINLYESFFNSPGNVADSDGRKNVSYENSPPWTITIPVTVHQPSPVRLQSPGKPPILLTMPPIITVDASQPAETSYFRPLFDPDPVGAELFGLAVSLITPGPFDDLFFFARLSRCARVAERAEQFGYHATRAEFADSILGNGFRDSQAGRLGGSGVYVNNSTEGAIAEYFAHNPGGPTPTVLRVEYTPGLNYRIAPPPSGYTTGPLPLAADTLTTESVRLPGTFNTLIRNGTATPLPPYP